MTRCAKTWRAFQDGGGREKMQEIMKSTTTKIDEVLDDGESDERGIMIQVNGGVAPSRVLGCERAY